VELPTRSYHSEFRLLDVREHHPFSDAMVLHVLELPKVSPISSAAGRVSVTVFHDRAEAWHA
jgi:hypothetical protein